MPHNIPLTYTYLLLLLLLLTHQSYTFFHNSPLSLNWPVPNTIHTHISLIPLVDRCRLEIANFIFRIHLYNCSLFIIFLFEAFPKTFNFSLFCSDKAKAFLTYTSSIPPHLYLLIYTSSSIPHLYLIYTSSSIPHLYFIYTSSIPHLYLLIYTSSSIPHLYLIYTSPRRYCRSAPS
jgi:hypothetical protein